MSDAACSFQTDWFLDDHPCLSAVDRRIQLAYARLLPASQKSRIIRVESVVLFLTSDL